MQVPNLLPPYFAQSRVDRWSVSPPLFHDYPLSCFKARRAHHFGTPSLGITSLNYATIQTKLTGEVEFSGL
ncbi:hypothetical protein BGLA2_310042 [Burkholderia gladioli]|nr:hypothetical protein BGLA2_310042 [Burkholderia gladioli]